MKVDIEMLKEEGQLSLNEKVNCQGLETKDALVKQINFIEVNANAYFISDDEITIDVDYIVDVDYLDSRTLDELKLTFDYTDNLLFTTNEKKADELEIDYVVKEIDLGAILFELSLINLPVNYSENQNSMILDESVLDEIDNRPFAQIFENKKK